MRYGEYLTEIGGGRLSRPGLHVYRRGRYAAVAAIPIGRAGGRWFSQAQCAAQTRPVCGIRRREVTALAGS